MDCHQFSRAKFQLRRLFLIYSPLSCLCGPLYGLHDLDNPANVSSDCSQCQEWRFIFNVRHEQVNDTAFRRHKNSFHIGAALKKQLNITLWASSVFPKARSFPGTRTADVGGGVTWSYVHRYDKDHTC